MTVDYARFCSMIVLVIRYSISAVCILITFLSSFNVARGAAWWMFVCLTRQLRNTHAGCNPTVFMRAALWLPLDSYCTLSIVRGQYHGPKVAAARAGPPRSQAPRGWRGRLREIITTADDEDAREGFQDNPNGVLCERQGEFATKELSVQTCTDWVQCLCSSNGALLAYFQLLLLTLLFAHYLCHLMACKIPVTLKICSLTKIHEYHSRNDS